MAAPNGGFNDYGFKVSGFTLVRNGLDFDYPFIESLLSLAPLVDELVVNVGISTDQTLQAVEALGSHPLVQGKLKIIQSDWPLNDPQKKRGGLILSEQTNIALDHCTGDWCIYLQADEVFHEQDYPAIQTALKKAQSRPDIHGLLMSYVHLYGSYDVEQYTRSAYRREVRAFKRNCGARSIGDAQSFRLPNGAKLNVLKSGGRVFHYGWVRTPEAMKQKTYFMDQLYHGQPSAKDLSTQTPHSGQNYRYKRFLGLRPFLSSHPNVMAARIQKKGWHWDLLASPLEWSKKDLKKWLLDSLEHLTGYRFFEYRSYKLCK